MPTTTPPSADNNQSDPNSPTAFMLSSLAPASNIKNSQLVAPPGPVNPIVVFTGAGKKSADTQVAAAREKLDKKNPKGAKSKQLASADAAAAPAVAVSGQSATPAATPDDLGRAARRVRPAARPLRPAAATSHACRRGQQLVHELHVSGQRRPCPAHRDACCAAADRRRADAAAAPEGQDQLSPAAAPERSLSVIAALVTPWRLFDAGAESRGARRMGFLQNLRDDVVFVRGALRALKMTTHIAKNPTRVFPLVMEELAAKYGDAPALISDREQLSYRALAARSNRYARWALQQGIAKGDTVCLLMPNRPEYMAIWIGITSVGGVVGLINTNLIGPSLAHCIDIAAPKHIIVAAELTAGFATARSLIKSPAKIWSHGESAEFPRIDRDDRKPWRIIR